MPSNFLKKVIFALKEKINYPHNRSRYIRKLLKDNFVNPSIMEIGVFEGDFSWEVLRKSQPKSLVLVDPYKHYHLNINDHTVNDLDQRYQRVVNRFKEVDSCKIFRNTLGELVSKNIFPNNSFDFIYIDGDHSFEGAYKDLVEAANLVVYKGFIVLDDYANIASYGIKEALNKFLGEFSNFYIYDLKHNQMVIQKL